MQILRDSAVCIFSPMRHDVTHSDSEGLLPANYYRFNWLDEKGGKQPERNKGINYDEMYLIDVTEANHNPTLTSHLLRRGILSNH